MNTWTDPVVEEVRAARAAYAETLRNDLALICADLREKQRAHGDRLVAFGPTPLPAEPRAA